MQLTEGIASPRTLILSFQLLDSQGSQTYVGRLFKHPLSLQITEGSFYALLGPNGAGKTTTLRMIAGLLRPDKGDVMILGHSIRRAPQKAKQTLAYLPDEPLIYNKLRPMEYLEFIAGLWGINPSNTNFV
ncbi:ATP-binding cassette domain-containing protein [Nostoc flagelliforme]|uniref:ATP-binding cassette domain-containing protein n=1 Tax=Nostoc flagelliforme TaxID=1306274 RepID=UPI000C2D3F21|nr:ATP-binding cassette domain-containing protein [Nostoc flagelliforme]